MIKKDLGTFLGAYSKHDFVSEVQSDWISTGLKNLNFILSDNYNGGIPKERIIDIFGDPGTGKSALCGSIAREFIKQWPNGRILWDDAEGALSSLFMEQYFSGLTGGLLVDRSKTLRDLYENIKLLYSASQEYLACGIPILYVVDSLPVLPLGLTGGEENDIYRASYIKTIYQTIEKLVSSHMLDLTFICINHSKTEYDKMCVLGVVGSDLCSHLRLNLSLVEQTDEYIDTEVFVVKNNFALPNRTSRFRIDFDRGIYELQQDDGKN